MAILTSKLFLSEKPQQKFFRPSRGVVIKWTKNTPCLKRSLLLVHYIDMIFTQVKKYWSKIDMYNTFFRTTYYTYLKLVRFEHFLKHWLVAFFVTIQKLMWIVWNDTSICYKCIFLSLVSIGKTAMLLLSSSSYKYKKTFLHNTFMQIT